MKKALSLSNVITFLASNKVKFLSTDFLELWEWIPTGIACSWCIYRHEIILWDLCLMLFFFKCNQYTRFELRHVDYKSQNIFPSCWLRKNRIVLYSTGNHKLRRIPGSGNATCSGYVQVIYKYTFGNTVSICLMISYAYKYQYDNAFNRAAKKGYTKYSILIFYWWQSRVYYKKTTFYRKWPIFFLFKS